jgi:ligand-binding sensor domain-containing protein
VGRHGQRPDSIEERTVQDFDGNIWMATAHGVSRWSSEGKFTTVTTKDGLSQDLSTVYAASLWHRNALPKKRYACGFFGLSGLVCPTSFA